ncbi:MAG: PA14 domain-containing protein [Planctomycetes bacterium]|nr:PA14 domain-containing protein [Planctomycetota bacterium]
MLPKAPPAKLGFKAPVQPSSWEKGENVWQSKGCVACHEGAGIPGLETRSDVASLSAWLGEVPVSSSLYPHSFSLMSSESELLASFLLQEQAVSDEVSPGWSWQCFEIDIESGELPDVSEVSPAAEGSCDEVGVDVRTRDDNFFLRFVTHLEIPTSGTWEFRLTSDDSSWMWLDGDRLITNEGLRPAHPEMASIQLDAGAHEMVVAMTECQGDEVLELEWALQGEEFQPIPPQFCSFRPTFLKGPTHLEVVPSEKWGPTPPHTLDPILDRMNRDGCLKCHARDGAGGLSDAARIQFVGTEDLGFEGRLPPDLTGVGARLQKEWVQDHLENASRARPYVAASCVVLSEQEAEAWAERFAQSDLGAPPTFTEHPPTTEQVQHGAKLVGAKGFQCIACHTLEDYASPAIQGMDLGLQSRRMHKKAFFEWLQHPVAQRPGTRMPTFWPLQNEVAVQEQEAIWQWVQFGDDRPIPAGLVFDEEEWALLIQDRPRLYGCSLKDLSARCLAVGTSAGVHYAYDLEHLRLAWIWAGDFLSTSGSWSGRTLEPQQPPVEDVHELSGPFPFANVGLAAESDPKPKLLGWTLDEEGWPTFRIELGNAVIEDTTRAVWDVDGPELTRTLEVFNGRVRVDLGPSTGGSWTPNTPMLISPGEPLEFRYSW